MAGSDTSPGPVPLAPLTEACSVRPAARTRADAADGGSIAKPLSRQRATLRGRERPRPQLAPCELTELSLSPPAVSPEACRWFQSGVRPMADGYRRMRMRDGAGAIVANP